MNPKIEKLEKEIEKTKTKIAEMQAKLHKLEEQKTELENTDYVAVARSFKLTPQQLADFFEITAGSPFGNCFYRRRRRMCMRLKKTFPAAGAYASCKCQRITCNCSCRRFQRHHTANADCFHGGRCPENRKQ
mgnify:CR=1 FL=1